MSHTCSSKRPLFDRGRSGVQGDRNVYNIVRHIVQDRTDVYSCVIFCAETDEMPAKKKGKKKGKGSSKGDTEGEEGGGKLEPTGKEQELRKELVFSDKLIKVFYIVLRNSTEI